MHKHALYEGGGWGGEGEGSAFYLKAERRMTEN